MARRLRYLNPSSTSRTRPVNGAATSTPGVTGIGRADEGEPAGAAQRGSRRVAAGAAGREDHGVIMNRGCASVTPWPSDCPIRASSCWSARPGSGKSTWAATWCPPGSVVSSDDLRAVVGRDRHDLRATRDALDVLELITARRLGRGLLTVIDSTGLDPAVRGPLPGAGRGRRRALPRRRGRHARAGDAAAQPRAGPTPCRRRWSRASCAAWPPSRPALAAEGFDGVHRASDGPVEIVPRALYDSPAGRPPPGGTAHDHALRPADRPLHLARRSGRDGPPAGRRSPGRPRTPGSRRCP